MKQRVLLLVLLTFASLTHLLGCGPRTQIRAFNSTDLASTVPKAAASRRPPAEAQPPRHWQRPLLYRVKGMEKPAYLLGTIHLPDARLDVFPPALQAAYDASDVVFTEIPMDPATQKAMLPFTLLPQEQRLKDVLPSPLYDRLLSVFATKGLRIYAFERLKPWVVAVQVTMLDQMFALAIKRPLDAFIEERAQLAGKEVDALETVQEQVSVFDALEAAEQVEFLSQTLESIEKNRGSGRNLLVEMMNAFLIGDQDAILSLLREEDHAEDPLTQKLMKRLLDDRNTVMTERIIAHLKSAPEKTQLFAVGSAHVLGNGGIVELLRKKGFEVQAVP